MKKLSKVARKEWESGKAGYGRRWRRKEEYVQNTLNEILKEFIKILGCLFCFVLYFLF